MAQPENDDQRAERLLRIALDMAVRIREEPPDAVVREAYGLDRDELQHALLLASACIPVDQPYSEVIWWTAVGELPVKPRMKPGGQVGLRPCGTRAAYRRHLDRGEKPDLACELGNRREENERRWRRKAAGEPLPRLPPDGAGRGAGRVERLAV